MKLVSSITKGVATFVFAAGLCAMTSGYAGLLGTTAQGTLNMDGGGFTNYFDLSAVPGTSPIDATVVVPNVEYPGNQPALQTQLGVTVHVSADIADHEILLTWINSSLSPVDIPASSFTFGLHPTGGQIISGVVFVDGDRFHDTLTFGADSVLITFGAFSLGSAASNFAHYDLQFVGVPEPSTYLLMGTLAGIALFAARRKQMNLLKQEA